MKKLPILFLICTTGFLQGAEDWSTRLAQEDLKRHSEAVTHSLKDLNYKSSLSDPVLQQKAAAGDPGALRKVASHANNQMRLDIAWRANQAAIAADKLKLQKSITKK